MRLVIRTILIVTQKDCVYQVNKLKTSCYSARGDANTKQAQKQNFLLIKEGVISHN
jgi:hypothetical protein